MSCQLKFSSRFWRDYEAAYRYIRTELKNPAAADAMDRELDRALDTVRDFPRIFAPYPETDETGLPYRAAAVKNYLAFYVLRGETAEFRRFLYAGSDLPAHLTS